MYTKTDIAAGFNNLCFKSTDSVLIHSSLRSLGEIEGRADVFIVDANRMKELTLKILNENCHLFCNDDPVDPKYYR